MSPQGRQRELQALLQMSVLILNAKLIKKNELRES